MTNEQYFEQMFPSLVNADAFTVGGRRFISMDKVLEIMDAEMDEVNCIEPKYWLRLNKMRGKVLDLKGDEQDAEV